MSEKILIIGDVMLDSYIKGESRRLSPEAPVPVVTVKEEFSNLGGAANVAQNIAELDMECIIFGIIGNDAGGKKITKLFNSSKVINRCVVPNESIPTTVKTRVISGHQQVVRFDMEEVYEGGAALVQQTETLFKEYEPEVVVVSDYAKGVCSNELLNTILKKNAKVLIDPKGNDWEKYRGAFLVKPNLKELSIIVGQGIKNDDEEIAHYGKEVLNKYNFQYLLITRGDKGMTLIASDKVSHHKVDPIRVFDISGAGDTVISVLAVLLQKGQSMEYAVNAANEAGRYVVAQPYTYAINKEELDSILLNKKDDLNRSH